jgi:hypothetical protein
MFFAPYNLAGSVPGKYIYDDSNKPKKLEFGVHAVMNHLLHVSLRSLFSRNRFPVLLVLTPLLGIT